MATKKRRIIEGRWSCSYCGNNDILGRHQICPSCGRQRDKNFKPRLPDDIKSNYVSEEESKKISKKPDWFCSFCQSYNSDNESVCISCGASKSESEANYFDIQKKKKQDDINYEKEPVYREPFYANNEPVKKKKKFSSFFHKSIFTYSLISILLVLCTFGLIYLFTPKEITMNVTEHSWSRSINIEEYTTVEENDWELPTNARLLYAQEEFYGTEDVLVGYETKSREVEKEVIIGYNNYTTKTDLGNGYFEEEEHSDPIYDTVTTIEYYEEPIYEEVDIYKTKYYYEIDKWLYSRSIKSSGNDKSPYWDTFTLKENERESSRSETYKIKGTVDGKANTITLSYEDWNKIDVGETVKLKVSFGYGEII